MRSEMRWVPTIALLVSVFLGLFDTKRALAEMIDNFDAPTQTSTLTANAVQFLFGANGGLGAGTVGGERDLFLQKQAGSNPISLAAGGVAGALIYSAGVDTRGYGQIDWDGADGAGAKNYTGLGGLNLADEGHDRFALGVLQNNLSADVWLTVYTDATNYSTIVITLPGGIVSPILIEALYADFVVNSGTGADFSDVGMISLVIDPVLAATNNLLVSIDYLETSGAIEVPTPTGASLGFLALTLACLGRNGRREV